MSYELLLKERDELQREAATANAELFAVLKQSEYRSADELGLVWRPYLCPSPYPHSSLRSRGNAYASSPACRLWSTFCPASPKGCSHNPTSPVPLLGRLSRLLHRRQLTIPLLARRRTVWPARPSKRSKHPSLTSLMTVSSLPQSRNLLDSPTPSTRATHLYILPPGLRQLTRNLPRSGPDARQDGICRGDRDGGRS